MRDFTIQSYRQLLLAIQQAGYRIITFEEYITQRPTGKYIILRHDVDELAGNALRMAQEEHALGIKATYYFRIVKQSNNPTIIRQIAAWGHEIGYHYEDLSVSQGDFSVAIKSFREHLEYFRQYYPVQTVCMHGSATSKFDNRTLWEHYQLSDFGLKGEPYLSLDFNQIYYLTDTGYAWDGGKYAVRDIVVNNHGLSFHSTKEIIAALQPGTFPQECMILAHTLWSPNLMQWILLHTREFFRNNIKYWSRNNKFVAAIYNRLVKMYWKQ